MDRRQFNSGFAALLGASALPVPAAANVAVKAAPAAPWGAYLFADLIARSRGTVDAGFLTQSLRVSPEIASGLMQELTQNGVIQTARAGGIAKAVNPIAYPQSSANLNDKIAKKVTDIAKDTLEDHVESSPEDAADMPDSSAEDDII